MEKLQRLKKELGETEFLLRSPRVNESTRYVLERLCADLREQIAGLEEDDANRDSAGQDCA